LSENIDYESKREALRERYLSDANSGADSENGSPTLYTGGVDHLALICSDIDATIAFYTGVLKMRLTNIIPNRDEPTSTHIFLDMGGGNLLAFFDFPNKGPAKTVRGVGGMHHLAMKATPEHYRAVLASLADHKVEHSVHGSKEKGSVYFRDPDDTLLEVTTGY
jgi:catechol 2,3-dioxygenase-like lactoylglutathione lyase family enzyme